MKLKKLTKDKIFRALFSARREKNCGCFRDEDGI